jgi:hypothetical protein
MTRRTGFSTVPLRSAHTWLYRSLCAGRRWPKGIPTTTGSESSRLLGLLMTPIRKIPSSLISRARGSA